MNNLPDLAFLDVETTGLASNLDDRVCEIAVARRTSAGEIIRWSSLINPGRPISPGSSMVNKISNQMVQDAPPFKDVVEKVNEMIEGAHLVCHNAWFDVGFLAKEFGICGRALPQCPIIDTLQIARQHFKFPSNKLSNLAVSLGVEVDNCHRAMADVDLTVQIFEQMWKDLSGRGVEDINQLVIRHVNGAIDLKA